MRIAVANLRFRPHQHLRRPTDIRMVREQGRRIDCRAFTVWWKHREPVAASAAPARPNAAKQLPRSAHPAPVVPAPRVCVIASTAAVGGAIRRNRAKRRLREVFRHQQHLVPPTCDLLLIARAAAIEWPVSELEKKFSDACRQIAAAPSHS